MVWLALIWVGLIALWGASEHWHVLSTGLRVARSVHLHDRCDDPPARS